MKKIGLICLIAVSAFGDFNNKLYSEVCYTYAENRRDLQPAGEKAVVIRAEIVNTAYVASQVIRWEREKEYEFPALILIESDVIDQSCRDALKAQSSSKSDSFVFYLAYRKAVYNNTVDALMKLAKPKKQ